MAGSYDLAMPRALDLDPADANLTGFASNVSGASWALTATSSGDGLAHQVSIRNDSGNDKSAISITIIGTDQNGATQTETITGPGASATVESTLYFLTLTSVTPASTWGADTADIGWVDEFATPTLNLNWGAEDVAAVHAGVTGTIDFTIQQTFDPLDGPLSVVWETLPGAGSQTATSTWNTTGGATGMRLIVNSYSSGAEIRLNVNQTFASNAPGSGSGGPTTEVDVAEWGGTATTLGQKAMAASVPVAIASNQGAVPVSSAQLPAGLGQAAMAASLSVVVANNQSAVATDVAQQGGVAFNATGLTTGQNALSTSAEEVLAANANRRFAEVKNADASISVYIGDDNTVTSANGHLLKAGESLDFQQYTGAIWAIAASGTPTVTFVEW